MTAKPDTAGVEGESERPLASAIAAGKRANSLRKLHALIESAWHELDDDDMAKFLSEAESEVEGWYFWIQGHARQPASPAGHVTINHPTADKLFRATGLPQGEVLAIAASLLAAGLEVVESRTAAPAVPAAAPDVLRDARRYRRLRTLGAAPGESKQLDQGTVLRFTGLDEFVDADLQAHPTRGEAEALPYGRCAECGFTTVGCTCEENEGRERELPAASPADGGRELPAMATACLELALQELPKAQDGLLRYFEYNGADHEREDCPEDDTCDCPLVLGINGAGNRIRLVLQAVEAWDEARHRPAPAPAAREVEARISSQRSEITRLHKEAEGHRERESFLMRELAEAKGERDELRAELLTNKASHNLFCARIGTMQEEIKADLVRLEHKVKAVLDERDELRQQLAAAQAQAERLRGALMESKEHVRRRANCSGGWWNDAAVYELDKKIDAALATQPEPSTTPQQERRDELAAD